MNLEERIKAGMLFYESGHVDPVNQEIEERLKNERKDCKELMFDYNHCRPGDQDRQLTIIDDERNLTIGPNVTICTTGESGKWQRIAPYRILVKR